MDVKRVGFIGLGNVGSKLALSLARSGFDLTVFDLRPEPIERLLSAGASEGSSPRSMTEECDVIITSLPNPETSAAVVEEADQGILRAISEGKVWLEMSTTSQGEVLRLGHLLEAAGGRAMDCPVSGGCHRAATGNISIFAGGDRATFEYVLPLLAAMGRQVLHTGPLGSASVLKVITNYLASVNLVALTEAFVTAQQAGMDLATTYEAIRLSSGNSFVHETESQLILNGSRKIDFTMDLVVKDLGLFTQLAEAAGVPLEIAPLVGAMFEDAQFRYGPREWSTNIVRRLEDATGVRVLAPGFPAELIDHEPAGGGAEVRVGRGTLSV